MKLSAGQEKAGSEMLGNVSVAWFTASVIAPFFLSKVDLGDMAAKIFVGLVLSIFFAIISLLLVRSVKK